MNLVCSDTRCQERHLCDRWHRRDERGPGVIHVGTLRKAWKVNTGLCERSIIRVRLKMKLPDDKRSVLASYLNASGKRRWIIAQYVRRFEIEAEASDEFCVEYNDEDDTSYIEEGWYEVIDNWDMYGSVAVHQGAVDRWQELPRGVECRSDGAPPDDHED